MDERFFSNSTLEFINNEEDKEEFENSDHLFGPIPEVFIAVVDSASSEQTAEPTSPVVANLSARIAANCSD